MEYDPPGNNLMNRTDRLLAIILELQRHTLQRAEDLAATFETSKRTIYRDIEALAEAGVPVVSVPGQGFSLIEGFFLPPVSFTKDEAIMLLLGADVMADSFDEHYGKSALNAAAKIEGVLTPQLRESVRRLKTSSGSTRLADPHALVRAEHAWYVSARDHRHGDVRRFRLERMEDLALTDQTYPAPDAEPPNETGHRGSYCVSELQRHSGRGAHPGAARRWHSDHAAHRYWRWFHSADSRQRRQSCRIAH